MQPSLSNRPVSIPRLASMWKRINNNRLSCCGGKYGQQKINVKLKGKTHFLEDWSASSRPFQEM